MALAKKAAPKKAVARRNTAAVVGRASTSGPDPVYVRDRAVQFALNLPYTDAAGNPSASASDVIKQARHFEDYILNGNSDWVDGA